MQGSLADFVSAQTGLPEPGRLVLGHHDDWLPGLTAAVEVEPIRRALAKRAHHPDLIEIGYRSGYPLF